MRLVHAACFVGVAFGVALVSAGCGGTAQARQVFMALDGAGDRVRDKFDTDTAEIFCDVIWAGQGTDNTVDALFIQDTGEPNLFDGSGNIGPLVGPREWAASEQAPPPGISTIAYQLQPPQSSTGLTLPFPVGHWTCQITVNGENAGSSGFDINYPTPDPAGHVCPPAGVASNGQACIGYPNNATCPSADNTNATCNCPPGGATRAWNCP